MAQPVPEPVKRYVLHRDDWKCRHCGRGDMLDPHHVIFRSAGGSNACNNLLTLCRKCHNDVHDGRLLIEIVSISQFDLTVKFWRQEGWKP